MNTTDQDIKKILQDHKKICVLGLSPDAHKPSQSVPVYMRSRGYDLVGVYPGREEINGFKIYPDLAAVPAEFRKMVNVFRRSEKISEVVEEVLRVGGIEVLWLQLGISHTEAEKRAEAAGIRVVSDRCLLVEHRRHQG